MAFLVMTLQLLLLAVRLVWCRQMVAVLALAVLPLLFAQIVPPPRALVGRVSAGPLSPCPVPRAGCAARRAESCQACPPEVLYVGRVL